MKKPKDVTDLANRLANAASTPLMAPAPISVAPAINEAAPVAFENKSRKIPKRNSVAVFLRVPEPLYEQYDEEAVRRTKATGRGVTVQQVMLDRLTETSA